MFTSRCSNLHQRDLDSFPEAGIKKGRPYRRCVDIVLSGAGKNYMEETNFDLYYYLSDVRGFFSSGHGGPSRLAALFLLAAAIWYHAKPGVIRSSVVVFTDRADAIVESRQIVFKVATGSVEKWENPTQCHLAISAKVTPTNGASASQGQGLSGWVKLEPGGSTRLPSLPA